MNKSWRIKTKHFIKKCSLSLHNTTVYILLPSLLLVATAIGGYYGGYHANLPTRDKQTIQHIIINQTKKSPVSYKPSYINGASCQSSQLKLGMAGVATLGLTISGLYFKFTNISDSTCTLDGYPTFVLKTSSGNIVSPTSSNIHENALGMKDPGPAIVTVPSSESAYFGIAWGSSNSEIQDCTNPITLMSTPPNNTLPVIASFNNLFVLCVPGGIQPAPSISITALATLNNLGLLSCPTLTNNQRGVCTPLPQPIEKPKPITLLNSSGTTTTVCKNTSLGVNYCSDVQTPIPTFTPTQASYTVNFAFVTGSVTGPPSVTGRVPNSNININNFSAESPTTYGPDKSGNFSVVVGTGFFQPIQLSVTDIASWHITVTENSQPLYPLINVTQQ